MNLRQYIGWAPLWLLAVGAWAVWIVVLAALPGHKTQYRLVTPEIAAAMINNDGWQLSDQQGVDGYVYIWRDQR